MFNLFPPGGIEQTIHVAVLLGLFALLALTEWFGWVFTGLVVPGYLAALALFAPASALAVLVEALVVLAVARIISDVLSRTAAWTRFFGRERFFLLVLLSVVVRQQSDLWLLPAALRALDARLGGTWHVDDGLHAVGLVLVPLTANMFWKLELRRGLSQVIVPTLFAFTILRFVLVPHTNLSCSLFELGQQNSGLDAIGSPKAYLIIIIGAYLGAHFNLRYGWDYGGILVPALLGLAFFSPQGLLICGVEAVVISAVVRLLTKLPGVSTANLEGPRKLALTFGVSFLLKYSLGWVIVLGGLRVAAADLFGFGYLVSSLLALKILQRQSQSRVLAPAIQVAFVSLIVGTCVSLALEHLAPAPELVPGAGVIPVSTNVLPRSSLGVMSLARVRATSEKDAKSTQSEGQLADYEVLWRDIGRWLASARDSQRASVAARARALGLTLSPLADSAPLDAAFALYETEERLDHQLGWETAILVPGAPGPVLEAPRPGSEAPSAEVAVSLCARVRCRAVIAAGIETWRRSGELVRRGLSTASFVELRSDPSHDQPQLYVRADVPDVDLRELWPGPLQLSWTTPARLQSASRTGARAAILAVHPRALWSLLARDAPAVPIAEDGVSLAGWLRDGLSLGSGQADQLLQGHAAPSQSELLYLEQVLFAPLLRTHDETGLNPADWARLMNRFARAVDYELSVVPDCAGPKRGCRVLAERVRPGRLGWGAVAVRSSGDPWIIEVPRPRREAASWRVGAELFQATEARAIYVTADVPEAESSLPGTVATPLHALHQAASDALGAETAPLVVQLRGFAEPISSERVVVLDRHQRQRKSVPSRLREVLVALDRSAGERSATRFFDGESELIPLASGQNAQLHYSAAAYSVPCAVLWLSEQARRPYFERDRDRQLDHLAAGGTTPTIANTSGLLVRPVPADWGAGRSLDHARFDALITAARSYAKTENVQTLRRFVADLPPTVGFSAGYATDLRQPFLLLEAPEGDYVRRALVLPGGRGELAVRLDEGTFGARLQAALLKRPELLLVTGRKDVL